MNLNRFIYMIIAAIIIHWCLFSIINLAVAISDFDAEISLKSILCILLGMFTFYKITSAYTETD